MLTGQVSEGPKTPAPTKATLWARAKKSLGTRRRLLALGAGVFTLAIFIALIAVTLVPEPDLGPPASEPAANSAAYDEPSMGGPRSTDPPSTEPSRAAVARSGGSTPARGDTPTAAAGSPPAASAEGAQPAAAGRRDAGATEATAGRSGAAGASSESRAGAAGPTGTRPLADGGVGPRPTKSGPAPSPRAASAEASAHGSGGQRGSEHVKEAEAPDGGVATRVKWEEASGESHGRRGSRSEDREEFRRVPYFVATGGAVLKGRVLEAETDRPIANAIIEARMGGSFVEAHTDAAGLFRIGGMAPNTRVAVWVQSETNAFVAENAEASIPGEGRTADTGTIHVLRANEFGGSVKGWLGMFAGQRSGTPLVSAVNPWLPAERAGILVGDTLVSIDGRDVRELGTRGINYLLRGPVGSKVTLVVQTGNGSPRKVTLERVQR